MNGAGAGAVHAWDVSPKRAMAIQSSLRHKVIASDSISGDPSLVGGVDIGFENRGAITRAAAVVLNFPSLDLVAQAVHRQETSFPYVPGLLSFREVPAALNALARLERLPDVILCDGQGFAHPRRFGLACHLGIVTGLPTIGVAKSRLVGEHAPLPEAKGNWVALTDRDEVIGAVLRTRSRVKPLYVSVGHKVCLETAIRIVLACTTRYRLPETTRRADRLASG